MQLINQKVNLEPAIRFEPSDFLEVNDGLIDYNYYHENSSWSVFYENSLEKIGIRDVKFMNDNSSLISINEFNDDSLKKLIRWDLNKRFEPEFTDYIPVYLTNESDLYNWFSGGYVLKNSTEDLISPACCVGFDDIESWETIQTNQNENWTMLWIGHPWVYYKLAADRVILSEYTESNEPSIEKSEEWLSIDKIDLIEAIQVAKNNIMDFINKVRIIIEDISKEPESNIKVFYEAE